MQMQKAANAKASKCVSWNTLEYECYNCNSPESTRETIVFRGKRAPEYYCLSHGVVSTRVPQSEVEG